jgi:hypothetical protein
VYSIMTQNRQQDPFYWVNPRAIEIVEKFRKGWSDGGGELISLPADEQAAMMKLLAGVGE